MLSIAGIVALFVLTYQTFKTARNKGRNGWLWGLATFAVGVGVQFIIPVLFAAGFAVYKTATGTPPDQLETAIMWPVTIFSIACLVLSFLAMYFVMKRLWYLDDASFVSDSVPPPPDFGRGL